MVSESSIILEGMLAAEAPRALLDNVIKTWRETRDARLKADKVVADIKRVEDELKTFIVDALRLQALEGVMYDGRLTTLRARTQPIVEDRGLLEDYIIKNHALELLQFRLSTAAVTERREAGEEIPGVGDMVQYDLSDKKAD